MKLARRSKVILALAVLAGLISVWGQGCGKPKEDTGSSNNGGGYGGLVLDSHGDYGRTIPESTTGIPDGATVEFYLYRPGDASTQLCSQYVSGWQTVGANVLNLIVKTGTGFRYYDSLCSASTAVAEKDVRGVAYNDEVFIYQQGIFFKTKKPITQVSELKAPQVFCRASSVTGSLDAGVDVLITRHGSGFKARLWVGRVVGDIGLKYVVAPFDVNYGAATSERYFANSFDLKVRSSADAATTGTLETNLGAGPESFSMSCWKHWE